MNLARRKDPPRAPQCRVSAGRLVAGVDLASLQLELRDGGGDGDAENGEAATHGARRIPVGGESACADFLKSVADK